MDFLVSRPDFDRHRYMDIIVAGDCVCFAEFSFRDQYIRDRHYGGDFFGHVKKINGRVGMDAHRRTVGYCYRCLPVSVSITNDVGASLYSRILAII